MFLRIDNTDIVKDLFTGWEETLIWSCLDKTMGEIYTSKENADKGKNPEQAMAILGDFCFLAGAPDINLVAFKPENCKNDFIIMVPQNEAWAKLIEEEYQGKAKKVTRYAIKKEADVFDEDRLQRIAASLPPEYQLRLIDRNLFEKCKAEGWSRDLVAQFNDYEMYQKLGLGVVILKGEDIVSGASSYSRYKDGIEIEIDTKKDYRRKGLAFLCGAKLILECRKRNLYPSWDAQNLGSVALARKLGYHFDHEYTAYEIGDY